MYTSTSDNQSSMTPDKALELLISGNERFRASGMEDRDLMGQVSMTSTGQWPFAAILGCIDSRVSAELVFDQGVGDLFSARVAGNVLNDDLIGSLEFSCKVAGARLIVVLGHTSCGAVKGACDGVKLGKLTGLLDRIQPALDATAEPSDAAERTSANTSFVDSVATRNVSIVAEDILKQSDVLREMADEGAIRVVGAMYDVASGQVTFRS